MDQIQILVCGLVVKVTVKREMSEKVMFYSYCIDCSALTWPKSANATNRQPVFHGVCFFHTLIFLCLYPGDQSF